MSRVAAAGFSPMSGVFAADFEASDEILPSFVLAIGDLNVADREVAEVVVLGCPSSILGP